MPLILPRRSLLAYPAGRAPGFDPNHPASRNLAMSAISVGAGANFIDLVHGSLPAFGAGGTLPTTAFDAAVGPSTLHAIDTDKPVTLPGTVSVPTSCTFAVMAKPIGTTPSTYGALIVTSAGYLFFLHGLKLNTYTNSDNDSSFSLSYGVPYFLAFSGSLVSGGVAHYVATNLKTGQVLQNTVTIGTTFASDIASTLYIGNNNVPNTSSNTRIAAAMCSPNLAMPLPQLLQWAADPWAFWYPNKTINLSAGSVTVLLYLRPDADSIDGGWTDETGGTNLFASIDETVASDTDYIQSSVNPTSDVCKISLSNPSTGVASPVKVRYRYKKNISSTAANLTVRLLQGVTQITSWTHTGISTSFVTVEQTLSAPELASITDFTDLYIELTASS